MDVDGVMQSVNWFGEPSDHHESMITVTPAWEGHLKVFE